MVILKNNNDIKIKSAALGMDGSYDNKENFKYLQKNKIKSAAIKLGRIPLSHQKTTTTTTTVLCCMIRKIVKTLSFS